MKKAFSLLALIFAFSPLSTFAQQQSLTVARCRADAASWGNVDKFNEYLKVEDQYKDSQKPNPNNTELARLPMNEILKRAREMADCGDLDDRTDAPYARTAYMYEHIWGDRMLNFLGRHNLWQQFQKEDAEGKR
jgi:hypothetical protein